jgi:dihydrofolate reductase
MKLQIMERKTWEKVPRATEMENSMTYVLNVRKREIQHPPKSQSDLIPH